MATLVDIASKTVYYNVGVPIDLTGWLVNPDLSAVSGYDTKFWIINPDNTIRLMTVDEQDQYLLADAQQDVCNKINDFRTNLIVSGFNYNGYVYDCDQVAMANIMATQVYVSSGATLPADFQWRTHDNTMVSFDNASFTSFFQAAGQWYEGIFMVSFVHKNNVNALTHYADVVAYDYTTGWPS